MGLLSVIYGLGLKGKRSLARPRRLPVKVISVGNITLGGTGKTPAVIAIAEEAVKRGLSPCILTRGYRGKAKGPCLIGKSQESRVKSQEAETGYDAGESRAIDPFIFGDEPALMAERLRDVPVIKCSDRYEGGMFALNSKLLTLDSSSVFILDDGFQHWRLHRDIDILLIDATDPFGNEKLIPEGRLREPLVCMKRAGIILITKADAAGGRPAEALVRKVRQYNREAPVFRASHRPAFLVNAAGETVSADTVKNGKVYAFAGIANPNSFRDGLISFGFGISALKSFRDHYRYGQKDIDGIIKEAGGADIITTEKDMVKLKYLQLPGNLFALRVEFDIEDSFYDILFKDI
ncbi:MAG: tetraacyldisaccharide 4'-kinase [Nitrospirae bacterium]|nr:tetraacyldisaccharide 4'-kinase [Nitrospirota bacterium]